MIPEIIHYCWFGGNPLPDDAKKCIASWRKFFPDYEIKEWNEKNFDLNCCDYVKEAYQAKKWAFVSDYARFWILYNYGGLYFDTDVEVIKPFDTILARGPFMGCEAGPATSVPVSSSDMGAEVAAGLGLGANAGLGLYKEILNYYEGQHFLNPDGEMNEETVVTKVTNILREHGFKGNGGIEEIDGITIYPPDFFCPMNYNTKEFKITPNTVSIHHYTASWHSRLDEIIIQIEKCNIESNKIEYKIRRIVSFPFRVVNKVQKVGWSRAVNIIKKRILRK